MSGASQTPADFTAKFASEREAIDRLEGLGRQRLGAGADDNIKLLKRIATQGIEKVVKGRSPSGKDAITNLVREFILYGAKAALLTGAQRGGDFLNNQLRGQWAERVALSLRIPGLHVVEFGPSGAAMPGEEDHRKVIMTFKEIHLLEGKRPDLLAFASKVWDDMADTEKLLASTWPERRLEKADDELIQKARCGVEVKNSTWHYGKRRDAGGPLSITVKQEEVAEIQKWSKTTGLPVLFMQVLFDELYCMSFRRMEVAIRRGHLYQEGDYERDKQTGGKVYHKFHIAPDRHLCGEVVFPSRSTAEIRVLEAGNVVPYIKYEPAQATNPFPKVVFEEIDYGKPA